MSKNAVGREIPEIYADEYGVFVDQYDRKPEYNRSAGKVKTVLPKEAKLRDSIKDVIIETGLKDGMTISFHHHFREGDKVLNMVLEEIAKLGIKNLSLASSSIANVHAPLIDHIKNGVITNITSSGLRDKVGAAISNGVMENPVVIRSHGGRARAIEMGDIHIDVAFLGAPSADEYGNANGSHGKATCGSLGYARVDAQFADKVVIITDNLVAYPNTPISIPQDHVDYVVVVDSIGDPNGIAKGATRYTTDPKELLIAEYAKRVIVNAPYYKNGFSFQAGTGGSALAVARYLKEAMIKDDIKAGFALGGLTGHLCEMMEEGLIEKVIDTQSFDLGAITSMKNNENHYEISASFYANPASKGAAVNMLDFVVLSALEVDVNYNVNVMTGSDGLIRGASGGHSDTAAGAKLAIILSPLVRGRIPTIVDDVNTIITPGQSIDIVVTEIGIAINPLRKDLIEVFKTVDIPQYTIEQLKEKAYSVVGKPDPIEYGEKVVALIEYRDGSLIDVVRQVQRHD